MKSLVRAVTAMSFTCACALHAQTCEPATTSHEADIFAIRSLSLATGRIIGLASEKPGTIRGGVEGVWLPSIDSETATPTTCRPGKAAENVNALGAAARVRVSVALPSRLLFEATWIPPITLSEMRGNVVGVALSTTRAPWNTVGIAVRAHATLGSIEGPFTCPRTAIENSASECFGGTESSDKLNPAIFGADALVTWTRTNSAIAWYAGAGYSHLRPRFHVNFLNAANELDTTQVLVNLHRIPLFVGASRAVGANWRTSAEIYATTRDGATIRLAIDRRLRGGGA